MSKALPATLALLATSAYGQGRLAVVEIDSPNMTGLAAQLTHGVVQAGRKQGYTIVAPAEIRARLGAKPLEELQACGGSPSCVATRLRGVQADRVVVGRLGRDEKHYLVRLWLIDLRRLEVVADVDRAILIASRRFHQDVNEAVPRLLRGEREARGTLQLTANVRNAAVTLNGEPVGSAPLSLELKPGKYLVTVEKKNHLTVERLVAVEANQVTREEVRLLLEPGAVPEEEEVPPVVAAKAPEGAGAGLRVPQHAWVAGGVALAAAGAATYFGIAASSTERRLKEGHDAQSGVYSGTRREALAAQRDAGLANLLFGVAGAALATGALLTVLHEEEPERVAPVVLPGGGGVLLGGSF